jgi:hypothetical protein
MSISTVTQHNAGHKDRLEDIEADRYHLRQVGLMALAAAGDPDPRVVLTALDVLKFQERSITAYLEGNA